MPQKRTAIPRLQAIPTSKKKIHAAKMLSNRKTSLSILPIILREFLQIFHPWEKC